MNPYNTRTLFTGTKGVKHINKNCAENILTMHPMQKIYLDYAIKTALIPSNRLRCDHPWLNFLMIVPVETVQKH